MKNFDDHSISENIPNRNNQSLTYLEKLRKHRKRRELTECLDLLELLGFSGEVAIFLLGLADQSDIKLRGGEA
jgi:hypothetical protein